MATGTKPIQVNRAPVLTLWAAVVAERLGHPPDTAYSLASQVAGTAATAKARRLGLAEEGNGGREKGFVRPQQTVHLLGRDVPMTHDEDGVVLADAGDGTPAPAAPPRAYVAKAFGQRLDEVRGAMQDLAASLPPEELNRVGFSGSTKVFVSRYPPTREAGARRASCTWSGSARPQRDPSPQVEACLFRSRWTTGPRRLAKAMETRITGAAAAAAITKTGLLHPYCGKPFT